MNKTLEILAVHEQCLQELAEIKKQIKASIESCDITKQLNQGGFNLTHLMDEKGFPKTHLWHAFNEKTESECGYGMRLFDADEVECYLDEEGCQHCIETLRLINKRPPLRKQLGVARRQIRRLGKEAIKQLENNND